MLNINQKNCYSLPFPICHHFSSHLFRYQPTFLPILAVNLLLSSNFSTFLPPLLRLPWFKITPYLYFYFYETTWFWYFSKIAHSPTTFFCHFKMYTVLPHALISSSRCLPSSISSLLFIFYLLALPPPSSVPSVLFFTHFLFMPHIIHCSIFYAFTKTSDSCLHKVPPYFPISFISLA